MKAPESPLWVISDIEGGYQGGPLEPQKRTCFVNDILGLISEIYPKIAIVIQRLWRSVNNHVTLFQAPQC